jgi:uncharacterized membrane protein YbhN (UPF0104 family)
MRRIALFSVKIAITLALLYAAMRKTDFSSLASKIDSRSLWWLGAAMVVAFVQLVIGAWRWRRISAYCGAPLAPMQAFRFNIIGSFFNQTLPSSIGGDAVRLWLVGRTGVGWRASAYSIFVDRAIGLIALAIMIVASLPWSLHLITSPVGRTALLLVDLAALASCGSFLTLGLIPGIRDWRILHHIRSCSDIANRALFDRKDGPTVIALSLLTHLLSIVSAWCIVQSILASVSFGEVFLLLPPVILISMAPVSIAGWGLRETTMGLAFGYAGMAAGDGVNVSLLYGAVYFMLGACGGVFWLTSAEKAARPADVQLREFPKEPS